MQAVNGDDALHLDTTPPSVDGSPVEVGRFYATIYRVLAPPQVTTYYTPDRLTANAPRKNGGTGRRSPFHWVSVTFQGDFWKKLREGTS